MEKFKDGDDISPDKLAYKINEIVDWINDYNLKRVRELSNLLVQSKITEIIEEGFEIGKKYLEENLEG